MSSVPTAPTPSDAAQDAGGPRLTIRRTGVDIALGVVLVVTGAVVLGDVALASVISVLFLGWTLLIGGAIALVLALLRLRREGSWTAVLSGALSFVVGLVFVRNPSVTLLALSLTAGALLIAGGIFRLFAAVPSPDQRLPLALSGALSLVLGVMILNRWPSSALWLLGTLLGIQLIVDGVLLMVVGRPRLTAR
jgi:uncharacterized membrane protein HdeD (DUF308 family)